MNSFVLAPMHSMRSCGTDKVWSLLEAESEGQISDPDIAELIFVFVQEAIGTCSGMDSAELLCRARDKIARMPSSSSSRGRRSA